MTKTKNQGNGKGSSTAPWVKAASKFHDCPECGYRFTRGPPSHVCGKCAHIRAAGDAKPAASGKGRRAPPPPPVDPPPASAASTGPAQTDPEEAPASKPPTDSIADDLREKIAAAKKLGEDGSEVLAILQKRLADHDAKLAEQRQANRTPEDSLRYAAYRLKHFKQKVETTVSKIAGIDDQLEKLQAEKSEQQKILADRQAKVDEWTAVHESALRASLKTPSPSGSEAIAVLQQISNDSEILATKFPPEQQVAAKQFVEFLPRIIELLASFTQPSPAQVASSPSSGKGTGDSAHLVPVPAEGSVVAAATSDAAVAYLLDDPDGDAGMLQAAEAAYKRAAEDVEAARAVVARKYS